MATGAWTTDSAAAELHGQSGCFRTTGNGQVTTNEVAKAQLTQ